MLGFTACLASSFTLFFLISTVRQRHRLRARQQETWESIVDEAENYAISLGCPMALVAAKDFLDLGCLTQFEAIRDAGKLRVLDTIEKIAEFQRNFIIVFLSHRWLALTTPDPYTVHFETMCAAVRRASRIGNVGLDKIFLWVDFCSIPQEHLATRELYLDAVPMYTLLCDMFIVIAPPLTSDDLESGIWTHLRGGWCRAELLTRLVGSGLHNLFFCESYDGSLQQVTREMVQGIDLNVFSGDFQCCSLQHVGCARCDREKLRTPMLGVYARYLRTCMSAGGTCGGAVTCVVQMDKDKVRLLPQCFDFVQRNDDMTTSTQSRELFGPLPEILEHRIRASRTQHDTEGFQSTTAPTLEPAQHQRRTSVVFEGGSASSTHGSTGLSQERAPFDEGELMDLDVPIQRELVAVTHIGTALRIGASEMQDSAQELPSMKVGRHERGTGSSEGADRSNTDLLQHEESGGVVTNLDVLVGAADLAIERVIDLDMDMV